MKKSCTGLFTMSLLFLLLSFITGLIFLDAAIHHIRLNSIETAGDNAILAIAQGTNDAAMIVFGTMFAASLILGILGVFSSKKSGRFSVLCIIFDFLPLVFMFRVTIGYLLDKDAWFRYSLLIFTFLALYMAGAVEAFKGRKQADS